MPAVVVIGGGIAGSSLAYFLARRGVGDVVILERESQPGYHATGRSAAVLYEVDANDTLARLKALGGAFLRSPPPGFSESPVFEASGIVSAHAASWDHAHGRIDHFARLGIELEAWTPEELAARVPVVDPASIRGALHAPRNGRIDVHGLQTAYLRHARAAGAEVRCEVEVTGFVVRGGRCRGVTTTAGEVEADWVVDAAGAWAGVLASRAGASAIEITPRRRCATVFEPPAGVDVSAWPMVNSDDHRVYFEPESGGVLMSPMDEVAMAPCDARPDHETIAAGFERLGQLAPSLVPRAVRRTWAGLRTFAPDRVHIVGEDPALPGFFWLAGQGGCGIETSPAIGAIAADLLVDGTTDRFDAALLSPARFR